MKRKERQMEERERERERDRDRKKSPKMFLKVIKTYIILSKIICCWLYQVF